VLLTDDKNEVIFINARCKIINYNMILNSSLSINICIYRVNLLFLFMKIDEITNGNLFALKNESKLAQIKDKMPALPNVPSKNTLKIP